MRKLSYKKRTVFAALLTTTLLLPAAAQEATSPETLTQSGNDTAQVAEIEKINQALEALTADLMLSLSPTGTYAVTNADDSTTGVPSDLLTQMTASTQSFLMKASDYRIKLIDQAQLNAAWSNAVEFNGADFEALVANTTFDAIVVLQTRAAQQGLDVSLQVIGASENNSGQVLASTKVISLELDWEKVAGVNIESIDDQISDLNKKIEESLLTEEVDTPEISSVVYSRYVDAKECPLEPDYDSECSPAAYAANDRIVANVDGKKIIADPGIDGSKLITDLGMDPEWFFNNMLIWQGDFDNDGYNDAIIGSDCGGSGCPPIYRIVLYKGNGRFSALNVRPLYTWDPPQIIQEGFHYVLKIKGAEGATESTARANEVELEFRVENGELIEKNVGGLSNAFNLKEFTVSDAVENDKDMSCSNSPEEPCATWEYDLSDDGVPETLSCGYWSRWQVLTDCEVANSVTGEVYKLYVPKYADKTSAQCKTISVLEELKDGMHQLTCDFETLELRLIPPSESRFLGASGVKLEESAEPQVSASSQKARADAELVVEQFGSTYPQAHRAQLQQILATWGLYDGAIDGDWGNKTKQSLVRFFATLQENGIGYTLNKPNDLVAIVNSVISSGQEGIFTSGQLTSEESLQIGIRQGEYDSANNCSASNQQSESRLKITGTTLEFYESSCEVYARRALSDGSEKLELNCTGEGEEWTTVLNLSQLANGGVRLTSESGATDYAPCELSHDAGQSEIGVGDSGFAELSLGDSVAQVYERCEVIDEPQTVSGNGLTIVAFTKLRCFDDGHFYQAYANEAGALIMLKKYLNVQTMPVELTEIFLENNPVFLEAKSAFDQRYSLSFSYSAADIDQFSKGQRDAIFLGYESGTANIIVFRGQDNEISISVDFRSPEFALTEN